MNSTSNASAGARGLATFKEVRAALGWKEGAQIVIDGRWADGHEDRLTPLAHELAGNNAALILATNLRAAVHAAKAAPNIPIVMLAGIDPVAIGLVASLARPGGMITGLAGFLVDLTGKYLELLLAAAPKVKRVGLRSYSAEPLANYRRATYYVDPDPQRRETRRPSHRATDDIRAGSQHENRQSARPHDAARDHGACG